MDQSLYIKFENLMHDRLRGSVLDLKVGYTSVTKNTTPEKVDRIKRKDLTTTSVTLGFRVTGYIIKDEKGEVIESVKKPKDLVKAEHLPDIFRKILKSNNQTEINPIARDFFLRRAREMLEYF